MPIRMTGMVSGMDTEAMVSELVSAYRLKSNKFRKAQTSLSWKQDQWKSLNSKVKALYTTLGSFKLSGSYSLRSASVSDSTKATASASSSAINGSYSLKILATAKTGYVTGAKLNDSITKDSTLSELGIASNGTITVTNGSGVTTDIEVDGSMKISEFTDKLNGAGLKASYDEANKRFHVAAGQTGTDSDFSLTGTGTAGADALLKLGLSVKSDANEQSYKDWGKYALNTDGGAYVTFDASGNKTFHGTYDAGKTKDNIDIVLAKMTDASTTYTNNTAQIEYAKAYKNVSEVNKRLTTTERDNMNTLMNEVNIGKVFVDDGGKLYDIQSDGTYKSRDDGSIHTGSGMNLTDGATAMSELQVKAGLATKETTDSGSVIYEVDKAAATAYTKGMHAVGIYESVADNADEVAAVQGAYAAGTLDATISALQTDADDAKQYMEDNKLLKGLTSSSSITDKITDAAGILDGTIRPSYSVGATRVDGQDAKIELNGAVYTSTKNDFSINGLNISALAPTGNDVDGYDEITITVANNTQGLYDKIKDFMKQYNSLINEITGKYNAPTTRGFEPLTSEEKQAMTDKEVEDWEKKLTDSVLRRDDTLDYLMRNMQGAMMGSYEVNGKNYSLSSFGISTLGVLYAEDNEENAFHIDGDKDNALTAAKPDKLMEALTNDPDTVVQFFQQMSTKTYDVIKEKMKSTELSSFDVVYNDKEMAKEYSDYTTTIKKWDDKLAQIEESYYKKFAAMEKALSTLNSQQSSLSGLLGGS